MIEMFVDLSNEMPRSLSFRATSPNHTLRKERLSHEKYDTIPDAP